MKTSFVFLFYCVSQAIAIMQGIQLVIWTSVDTSDNSVFLHYYDPQDNIATGCSECSTLLPKAQKYQVSGWWKFYPSTNYYYDSRGEAGGWQAISLDATSVFKKISENPIPGPQQSARSLGPKNTRDITVTFYQDVFEQGKNLTVYDSATLTGDFANSESLFFTGRATWSISCKPNGLSPISYQTTESYHRFPAKFAWPSILQAACPNAADRITTIRRIA